MRRRFRVVVVVVVVGRRRRPGADPAGAVQDEARWSSLKSAGSGRIGEVRLDNSLSSFGIIEEKFSSIQTSSPGKMA